MPQTSGVFPEYKISDIDKSGTTKYFGYVDKRGYWYILRLTSSEARYTKGTTNYTTNWTNRENLSYSRFDEVF